jgi:hypothetical protein
MSQPKSSKKGYKYPWEDPMLREDVTRGFTLRLNEPYLHKLRYISEKTPPSMQQFCQKVLKAAINRQIRSLVKNSR